VLERAKIEKLRVHDLRHSKASVGAELGFSLPMIGAMLGHARASTTERYAHLAADPVRSAERRVQARIANALSQRIPAHDPLSDGTEAFAQ
jgi:site-specific recombinase XerD